MPQTGFLRQTVVLPQTAVAGRGVSGGVTVGGANIGEQSAGINNHDHGSEGVARALDDRVDLRRIGGIGDDRHDPIAHGRVDVGNEIVTTSPCDGEVLPPIKNLSGERVSSNAAVHDQHDGVGVRGVDDYGW